MAFLTKQSDFFENFRKKLEKSKNIEKKSACGVTPSTRSIFFKITIFVTPPDLIHERGGDPHYNTQKGGGTFTLMYSRGCV